MNVEQLGSREKGKWRTWSRKIKQGYNEINTRWLNEGVGLR